MAAPNPFTIAKIVTEGVRKKLNGSTPRAEELDRATEYGLEKVKRDIMGVGKTWRPLIVSDYSSTTSGISQYDNPADFEAWFAISVMQTGGSGTISSVTNSTTIVLPGAETITQTEAEGKWLSIVSGTGAGQSRQIATYSATTRTAVVSPAFTTLPTNASTYSIGTSMTPLKYLPMKFFELFMSPGTTGTPAYYSVIPDDTYRKTVYYPTPDGSYVLRRRYYADLRKLDQSDDLFETVISRWAAVFIQGVYVWSLGEDDTRYQQESAVYHAMLQYIATQDLDGTTVPPVDAKKAEKDG